MRDPSVRHPHFTLDDEDGDVIVYNGDETGTGTAPSRHQHEPESSLARRHAQTDRSGCQNGHNFNDEHKSHKQVYPPKPQSSFIPQSCKARDAQDRSVLKTWWHKAFNPLPSWLAWIPPHLNWKGLRPVVRSSIAAWCGVLLVLFPASRNMLGQASFLCLVVASISPAAYPIAQVLETTFFQFLLVSASWAWACIIIAIAHAVRSEFKFTQAEFNAFAAQRFAESGLTGVALTNAIQRDLYGGAFVEASSSVVCAILFGVAAGGLLWFRGWIGPGPMLFGIIFALILQAITVTIAALIPYPNYSLGLVFFLPFCCQQAIQLACTILIFPETLAHQFSDRLIGVLTPLRSAVAQQRDMLGTDPRSTDWLKHQSLRTKTGQAVAGLALLAASEHNLTREITYARISGRDFSRVLTNMRLLVARASGFVRFYETVELHLHRGKSNDAKGGHVVDDLVIRLGRSRNPSNDNTPTSTRPPSPEREGSQQLEEPTNASHAESLSKALEEAANNKERGRRRHAGTASPPSHGSPHRAMTTTAISRIQSRATASAEERTDPDDGATSVSFGPSRFDTHDGPYHHRRRPRSRHRGNRDRTSHLSLPSLLHDVLHANVEVPRPVGLVESMRYADLEDQLANPQDEEHIQEIISLLLKASGELIDTLDDSVGHLMTTIHRLKDSDGIWINLIKRNRDSESHAKACEATAQQIKVLKDVIARYRDDKRLEVIRPFHRLFDPIGAETVAGLRAFEGGAEVEELRAPSHRGLFWCLSYQFTILGWAEALLDLFNEVARVEKKRTKLRLWLPTVARFKFGNTNDDADFEEENPEMLSRLDPEAFVAARNPDFRPPTRRSQIIGIQLYSIMTFFSRADFLFALKAAIILALISMPAYFRSTAWFFYREKGVWVVIMAALSLTQYVADTGYAVIVRLIGTLVGGTIGLLLWSIAAQDGTGNPYALAAVMAVAFPPIFFYRIHYTPPIEAILPTVTIALVIGYSWQNAQSPRVGSIGFGWDVAWRRMLCVMIGTSIAFVGAYLPPKATQKGTIRKTYAKVAHQLGGILCQVLSFGLCKDNKVTKSPKGIVKRITGLRVKLAKTTARKAMVRFERSLRGPWPTEHCLFTAVLASLNTPWTKALLQRSQLLNQEFISSVCFAFQTISSSLEFGLQLPMLYTPLLERFLTAPETVKANRPYGYDVVLQRYSSREDHSHHVLDGETKESEDVFVDDDLSSLPQHVDLETLSSLEYLRFSTGISIAYALWNRVDRLMLVTKSVCGENYLVFGLDKVHRNQRRDWSRQWYNNNGSGVLTGGGLRITRTREERGLLGLEDDSARPSFDDEEEDDNHDQSKRQIPERIV
ncbi:hypothetical protein OIO90_005276 [Microbotryomycetes sp. JL221]|nr:hypothetical protein OIO90_005276 [Microbotryomycetes sp. JL221]